jgi:hypothetical protein
MTQATELTKKANELLASFSKGKKGKKRKSKGRNPMSFETRHGVLVPWGGAMGGGSSDRKSNA